MLYLYDNSGSSKPGTNFLCALVPLKKFSIDNHLKIHELDHEIKLKDWVVPSGFDIAIVSSFGKFIPSSVLKKFPCGTLNVHPSLLPRFVPRNNYSATRNTPMYFVLV